jgi:hypothetical protein
MPHSLSSDQSFQHNSHLLFLLENKISVSLLVWGMFVGELVGDHCFSWNHREGSGGRRTGQAEGAENSLINTPHRALAQRS